MPFEVKDGVNINDLKKLNNKLLYMFGKVCGYCDTHNLPLTITSIFSDRENVKRKSNTHETFRAIDIRSRDWSEQQILDFETWCNIEFKEIAAIRKDGSTRAALYHNRHIHLQVRP